MTQLKRADLLARLDLMTPDEIKRVLVHELTSKPLGLVWEADLIERDRALNSNVVLPELVPAHSKLSEDGTSSNLIIEGDNFDALRLLKTTHAGKIQVILIDPPYNTGNKDWVYNDSYLSKEDRWRHSTWLEFMYQRMVLARDLLAPNGVIMICINDENRARLELMMENVMPGRKAGCFVWKVRSGGNDTGGTMLSDNHEYVLVYANPGFSFIGEERDESAFQNPDNDPRGPWTNGDLVKAHNAKERPEAYYHIQNPETGRWYVCDANNVWRFASASRSANTKLRSDPMEVHIEEKRILWPAREKTVTYDSVEGLLAAIKDGTAPKQLDIYTQLDDLEQLAQTDRKVQRLLSYIVPLEQWVGREIGYGKPRFKRFRTSLKRDVRPVSSWLHPKADGKWVDDDEYEDALTYTVGGTGEGTTLCRNIFGGKDFPYPKPMSLFKALLAQSARPGDTVLDFFAGSGTTGHAVLELNSEDGGDRSFILCSSKEATAAEPEKNLCLDVTAERIRRVIDGYAKTDGLEGDFAYLKLALVEEADLLFDATGQHAHALVSMRETGRVGVVDDSQAVWLVAAQGNAAIVMCPEFSPQAHTELEAMPYTRLIVYTDRPDSVMELFAETQKNVTAHSLDDVLAYGQTRKGAVPTQGNTLTEVEA